jgi:hypothetical protein
MWVDELKTWKITQVQMQVDREKSMADTAYYKALKDIEINKVSSALKFISF